MKAILTWLVALVFAASTAMAEGKTHHVAFQVNQNDPALMNLVLNNVQNLEAYFKEKGEAAKIEVVAYGPGLNMYIEGKSPVAQRIAAMSLESPDVTFSACNNTLTKMEEKAGHKIPLLSESRLVPSGAARLVELQEEGYSYIRP